MMGNYHVRCGAGEKLEEAKSGRNQFATKSLPIAIVPLRDIVCLERFGVSAEPQCALYRYHPGKGTADHRGSGGYRGHHGAKRQGGPPLHRTEAAAAGEGYMRLIHRILQLLFPPKCVLCGKVLEKNETDLCTECRLHGPECPVKRTKLPFLDSWLALWHYEGHVRGSLLRYKFHNKRHYALTYGRLLAMKIAREREDTYDLITWVPISRWRKLRRGYDQVELLSQAVCAELQRESVCCLRKIRHNPPQSRIVGQAQRRANVLGVYEAVEPEAFRDKRILLLDDIITTGATVGECARVLLTAGAKEVHCAAIAAAKQHK